MDADALAAAVRDVEESEAVLRALEGGPVPVSPSTSPGSDPVDQGAGPADGGETPAVERGAWPVKVIL